MGGRPRPAATAPQTAPTRPMTSMPDPFRTRLFRAQGPEPAEPWPPTGCYPQVTCRRPFDRHRRAHAHLKPARFARRSSAPDRRVPLFPLALTVGAQTQSA
jgi:hypothetical protein